MENFLRWLREWDWRPLARLLTWSGIAALAVRYGYLPQPEPRAIMREIILGWLLSFGLLTWIQVRLVTGAWWVFMALEEWTYDLSAWIVRPVVGTATFAVNFLAAFAVEIGLAFGAVGAWRTWHMGARLLVLVDLAWRATCG
ncbi:MAG: hypothetical protein ABL955_04160 [Elusimicrobiota bacterium]